MNFGMNPEDFIELSTAMTVAYQSTGTTGVWRGRGGRFQALRPPHIGPRPCSGPTTVRVALISSHYRMANAFLVFQSQTIYVPLLVYLRKTLAKARRKIVDYPEQLRAKD